MSATITFGSYSFTGAGNCLYARKDKFESETPGAPPIRKVVTLSLHEKFLEPSFADNESRYRALLAALDVPEALLTIDDENAVNCLSVRARPVQSDRPKQWGQHLLEVAVEFVFVEDLSTSATDATFTPSGGSPLTLGNVTRFSENLRTVRFNPRLPNRRETQGSVLLTGKLMADPTLAPAARRAALVAAKVAIDGASDCKEGGLVFGDFSQTIRVEQLNAEFADADQLVWSLTGQYQRFPSGSHAEADFRVESRQDLASSTILTTVRGTVRAESLSHAKTKVDAIQSTYASGRMLLSRLDDDGEVSGGDGDAFLDLNFSMEFRELASGTSYTLSVATVVDSRAGTTTLTFSGRVTAATLNAAQTKARALGDGKYPFEVRSSETVNSLSVAGTDPAQFVEFVFSYEYLTRNALKWAEVSSETVRPTFGNATLTVSGFTVADTQANALTFARTFKEGSSLVLDEKETPENIYRDDGSGQVSLFVKVTFSYQYHLATATGAISYEIRTSANYDTRETTVSYSGTAYGATESDANTLIDTLISGASGRKGVDERTSKFDKSGSYDEFLSRSFSITRIAPLDAGGDDILEASYTLEKTLSIDHAVLTPIPYSTADVQEGCGTTVGQQTASGSITALNLSTATAWAAGKMPAGGYQLEGDGPRTRTTEVYYPLGTTVKAYTVAFDYTKHYTDLSS